MFSGKSEREKGLTRRLFTSNKNKTIASTVVVVVWDDIATERASFLGSRK